MAVVPDAQVEKPIGNAINFKNTVNGLFDEAQVQYMYVNNHSIRLLHLLHLE